MWIQSFIISLARLCVFLDLIGQLHMRFPISGANPEMWLRLLPTFSRYSMTNPMRHSDMSWTSRRLLASLLAWFPEAAFVSRHGHKGGPQLLAMPAKAIVAQV
jgi:hypothetical protein